MSNRNEVGSPTPSFNHYGPEFYQAHGESDRVMERATHANNLTSVYLYSFGVESLYDLPPEIQGYLLNQARIVFTPEEYDD